MLQKLRTFVRFLRRKRFAYEPLITVTIDSKAILHNLHAFQTLTKNVVAPVLKSNAYGHGLVQIAKILEKENAPFFCIDSLFEAAILRENDISSPLLIIGYTPINNILNNRLKRISFGIMGLEELRRASAILRRPLKIHLKADTGMNRLGIQEKDMDEAISIIHSNPLIELDGVYSHLGDADTPGSKHVEKQIETWNRIVEKIRGKIPSVKFFHCAATAGSFYADKIEANAMRLGIGLYGLNVGIARLNLRPALEMRTRITSLRKVPVGGHIGYNATFDAKKETLAATIPVGYNEGVDRRLSNLGAFLVRGIPCPIAGRVSMNISSIDVSAIQDAKLDEDVIVISKEPGAPNSIENIARLCSTIPYEIMVHISPLLRRIVI